MCIHMVQTGQPIFINQFIPFGNKKQIIHFLFKFTPKWQQSNEQNGRIG